MSQRIKVKVHPNDTLRFPGLCVNCEQPAQERMEVRGRHGRTIRQINVPICDNCARILRRESAQEERLRKLSWLAIGLSVILAMAKFYFMIADSIDFWLGLSLISIIGLIVAVFVWWLFRQLIYRAALPEKKAIRQAAQMESFSWWTATFVFANESFSERFLELNEPLLVDN